jgi:hypothetical protein
VEELELVFVTLLLLPAAIVEELELVWVCCARTLASNKKGLSVLQESFIPQTVKN